MHQETDSIMLEYYLNVMLEDWDSFSAHILVLLKKIRPYLWSCLCQQTSTPYYKISYIDKGTILIVVDIKTKMLFRGIW